MSVFREKTNHHFIQRIVPLKNFPQKRWHISREVFIGLDFAIRSYSIEGM